MTCVRQAWRISMRLRVLLTACTVSALMGGATLAHADIARAEYLSPYPNYSYTDSGLTNASDPLNVLFGGTSSGGYYGTQYGIRDRLAADLGWGETDIASHQYVKFQSNLGNWVVRQEKDGDRWFEEAMGPWYSSRYHARLFRDKFATAGGSYAEMNCVSSLHHEYFDLGEYWHVIDRDWEQVEESVLYELVEQNPDNWYSYDAYYNCAFSMAGWYLSPPV
jgi:hypothetical protein